MRKKPGRAKRDPLALLTSRELYVLTVISRLSRPGVAVTWRLVEHATGLTRGQAYVAIKKLIAAGLAEVRGAAGRKSPSGTLRALYRFEVMT